MSIDLIALLDREASDPPPIATQDDLVDLHAQILSHADRRPWFVDAAQVISRLSLALSACPAADPRTVDRAVTLVLEGLRRDDLSPGKIPEQFTEARASIANIELQRRAATAAPRASH